MPALAANGCRRVAPAQTLVAFVPPPPPPPLTYPRLVIPLMTRLLGYRYLSSILNFLHPNDLIKTSEVDLARRENPLACQANSKFATLPGDIVLLIVAYLNKNAQASLVRSCRHLRRLLEVLLYRHIEFPYPPDCLTNDRLFRTLAERPDLPPCIVTYHGLLLPTVPAEPQKRSFLDWVITSRKPSFEGTRIVAINETESFKRTVAIFSNATNIADLHLTDRYRWDFDPQFEPIKQAIAKMSLRRLSMWSCNDLHSVICDQPELEELQLVQRSFHMSGTVDKPDVPKLRSLSADLHHAASLVPGRPIERLKLLTFFGCTNFDERLFDKLALSTGPITDFDGILLYSWDDAVVRAAFGAIARTLPNVEKLTITVGPSISGRIILDEIPSLQYLRDLTFLRPTPEIAGDRAESGDLLHNDGMNRIESSTEDWNNLFTRLKEDCPSLVRTRYMRLILTIDPPEVQRLQ
ncbi:hypothetical protein FRC00_010310 [Tulasnella sp. 408]|nr:hypothetical protein FRC00_010310 [Tulasnella sp. 408]